jgi:hypothetical protein
MSPASQTCQQHKPSPTFVTNVDVTKKVSNDYIKCTSLKFEEPILSFHEHDTEIH